MTGLQAELKYPRKRAKLCTAFGNTQWGHNGTRMAMIKNGSQQTRKQPTTIPSVRTALRSWGRDIVSLRFKRRRLRAVVT